jgi:hypothetical protein
VAWSEITPVFLCDEAEEAKKTLGRDHVVVSGGGHDTGKMAFARKDRICARCRQ